MNSFFMLWAKTASKIAPKVKKLSPSCFVYPTLLSVFFLTLLPFFLKCFDTGQAHMQIHSTLLFTT